MMITKYTPTAKPSPLKVSDKVFAAKTNPALIAQAVRVYLSNQRQGTKHAKTRGEVHGTGKKIYRQKGTGRARHGDRLAPIFVKGGVAHGPKGNENYHRHLPLSMRLKALTGALSQKAKNKRIFALEGVETKIAKTAQIQAVIAKLNLGKTALVISSPKSPLVKAARNLAQVTPIQAQNLTTYDVIKYPSIVLTTESIPVLEKLVSKS